MKGNRFFSVPYDLPNDVKIRCLAHSQGSVQAVGRWVILLGMLYDQDGLLDLSDATIRKVTAQSLELEDLDGFMVELGKIGLIDGELYRATSHVVNAGVLKELEYYEAKSKAGKKGGINSGKARRKAKLEAENEARA